MINTLHISPKPFAALSASLLANSLLSYSLRCLVLYCPVICCSLLSDSLLSRLLSGSISQLNWNFGPKTPKATLNALKTLLAVELSGQLIRIDFGVFTIAVRLQFNLVKLQNLAEIITEQSLTDQGGNH